MKQRVRFDLETLLVRFRSDASSGERADALAQHRAVARGRVRGTRFELIEADDAEQALERLK